MSFLFGGAKPQVSSEQKIEAAMTEMEMVAGMYQNLSTSCFQKCVPKDYRESDLNKGESVCLDRCVAKFFEVNVKISEKMQGEAALKQGGAGPAGGVFGM